MDDIINAPNHIDVIQANSEATDERTELTSNLVVDEKDLVFSESKEGGRTPFEGFLTVKEIYLLRQNRFITFMAPSRTSKSFVKMPAKL